MPRSTPASASRDARGLFARVLSDDGPTHVGIVLDRVALGAATRALVEFSLEDAPLFAVGSRVWLGFAGAEQPTGVDSMASVVFRAEDERFRRYEFTFGADAEAVRGLLDRREAERVRPGAGARVQFRARGSHERFEGTLADLSTSGVAVAADVENESALLETDEVEVALFLEPDDAPVLAVGRLVWRRLTDARVHYGVELQGERTPGFGSARERIARYVEACARDSEHAEGAPDLRRAG